MWKWRRQPSRLLRVGLTIPLFLSLGGCNFVLLNPAGDVAMQQRDVLLASVALMLLIILPVMAATAFFAWKYRHSNTDAPYDPEWHHSARLETLIWAAPLAIIIALGAIAWVSTHLLDPYRPLSRIGPMQSVADNGNRLKVQVVSLNWKWLFIYPELGIATVNEMAAPVDTPISFQLTSSDIMNSFFVPALAGQVYTMAGMETKLHAVINRPGAYKGFSANYSGAGFSEMRFKFRGMAADDFDKWLDKVKATGGTLDWQTYLKLAKPSEDVPVIYYKSVDPNLFNSILDLCAKNAPACASGGASSSSEQVPAPKQNGPKTFQSLTPQTKPAGQ